MADNYYITINSEKSVFPRKYTTFPPNEAA